MLSIDFRAKSVDNNDLRGEDSIKNSILAGKTKTCKKQVKSRNLLSSFASITQSQRNNIQESNGGELVNPKVQESQMNKLLKKYGSSTLIQDNRKVKSDEKEEQKVSPALTRNCTLNEGIPKRPNRPTPKFERTEEIFRAF